MAPTARGDFIILLSMDGSVFEGAIDFRVLELLARAKTQAEIANSTAETAMQLIDEARELLEDRLLQARAEKRRQKEQDVFFAITVPDSRKRRKTDDAADKEEDAGEAVVLLASSVADLTGTTHPTVDWGQEGASTETLHAVEHEKDEEWAPSPTTADEET